VRNESNTGRRGPRRATLGDRTAIADIDRALKELQASNPRGSFSFDACESRRSRSRRTAQRSVNTTSTSRRRNEDRERPDEHVVTLRRVTPGRKSGCMTTTLEFLSLSVVEIARDRSKRPRSDIASAGGLRSLLEDGTSRSSEPSGPCDTALVRTSSLHQRLPRSISPCRRPTYPRRSDRTAPSTLSVGCHRSAFDDAVATWRAEVGANELIQQPRRTR